MKQSLELGDEVVLRGRVVLLTHFPLKATAHVYVGNDVVCLPQDALAAMQPVDATPAPKFKVGDTLSRGGFNPGTKVMSVQGDSYDILFGDGSRGLHPTEYMDETWTLVPAPVAPPFAVGDFVKHGPADGADPEDGGAEVLSIDGNDITVRFRGGPEGLGGDAGFKTKQSRQRYVKCTNQDACRRIFAVARVERAQARVRKLRAEMSNEDAMASLGALGSLANMRDMRACLRDCLVPASNFVSCDGRRFDMWGQALIDLTERLG